jgi:hypothetical protein
VRVVVQAGCVAHHLKRLRLLDGRGSRLNLRRGRGRRGDRGLPCLAVAGGEGGAGGAYVLAPLLRVVGQDCGRHLGFLRRCGQGSARDRVGHLDVQFCACGPQGADAVDAAHRGPEGVVRGVDAELLRGGLELGDQPLAPFEHVLALLAVLEAGVLESVPADNPLGLFRLGLGQLVVDLPERLGVALLLLVKLPAHLPGGASQVPLVVAGIQWVQVNGAARLFHAALELVGRIVRVHQPHAVLRLERENLAAGVAAAQVARRVLERHPAGNVVLENCEALNLVALLTVAGHRLSPFSLRPNLYTIL